VKPSREQNAFRENVSKRVELDVEDSYMIDEVKVIGRPTFSPGAGEALTKWANEVAFRKGRML
jgi:hypothetical protein